MTGLLAWLVVLPGGADGEQGVGLGRAGIQEQPLEPDAVDVRHMHRIHAAVIDDRRVTDPEDDRMGWLTLSVWLT